MYGRVGWNAATRFDNQRGRVPVVAAIFGVDFHAFEGVVESEGTYPIYKVTGDKSSKQLGKMMVVLNDKGEHETIAYDESRKDEDQLVLIFENGKIVKDWTWDEVRANVQKAKDAYVDELEREK